MAEPKSFQALERILECSDARGWILHQANAELKDIRELLAASIIVLNGKPTPRFPAAIAACLPGKELAK